METLAFIEELNRHGDVVSRHALKQLPAHIGRGYDVDVFVDDPYVAAAHCEIRLSADGTLEAIDMGTLNGTHRLGGSALGGEVFRIGQTQLRIRLPGHIVPSELPLPKRALVRHPGVFAGSVGLLACLIVWNTYLATFTTNKSEILSEPIGYTILALLWVSVWSLVCRTLHGKGNFIAHGIVAFLGLTVFQLVKTLTSYINFAFDLHGKFGRAWIICSISVLAVMLYFHLRLTVRLSRRSLAVFAVLITSAIFGGFFSYGALSLENQSGLQFFDNTVKPSAFLYVKGVAPSQFVGMAQHLKENADNAASTTN